MRLIDLETNTLKEFDEESAPIYAILSHTWAPNQEVLYEEFVAKTHLEKQGWAKIHGFCNTARQQGFGFVWVDTCCIDKRSSSELSEAINSMCRWYENAVVCFVYLADVARGSEDVALFESRWWTRGWTLQELLAPRKVDFYALDWSYLNQKASMHRQIAKATGISRLAMNSLSSARSCSVAARMSWAADRETTRVEDRAYSLLGLFGVHMPLLYGERENAFLRLQEEISRVTNDQTIFAWDFSTDYEFASKMLRKVFRAAGNRKDQSDPTQMVSVTYKLKSASIFAPSPDHFKASRYLVPMDGRGPGRFEVTNQNLRLQMPIVNSYEGYDSDRRSNYSIGIIACRHREDVNLTYLGILLHSSSAASAHARMRLSYLPGPDKPAQEVSTFVLDVRNILKPKMTEILVAKTEAFVDYLKRWDDVVDIKIIVRVDARLDIGIPGKDALSIKHGDGFVYEKQEISFPGIDRDSAGNHLQSMLISLYSSATKLRPRNAITTLTFPIQRKGHKGPFSVKLMVANPLKDSQCWIGTGSTPSWSKGVNIKMNEPELFDQVSILEDTPPFTATVTDSCPLPGQHLVFTIEPPYVRRS